jgi:MFS family permease
MASITPITPATLDINDRQSDSNDGKAMQPLTKAEATSDNASPVPTQATATPPIAKSAPTAHPRARWFVLFVSAFGVLLASIQTSALIIAFPDLVRELHTTLTTMIWVLLVVMLVIAAIVPLAGRLGDMFGQAKLYNMGFIIFTISSLLSGFCTTENKGTDLIGYRVIMGLGAAFLFTNSGAILTDAFAPYNQVGLAQGVFGLAASLGTILGPVLGGVLAVKDWRWIFWMNVPIGGACCIMGLLTVKDAKKPKTETDSKKTSWSPFTWHFDLLGAILIIACHDAGGIF